MTKLSTAQAAKQLNVALQTIRNWEKTGALQPHEITPTGRRFYTQAQLDQYQQQQQTRPKTAHNLSIHQMAKRLNLTAQVLKEWERNRILTPASIAPNGTRSYTLKQVVDVLLTHEGYELDHEYLSVAEVAAYFGVTMTTIRNWEEDGRFLPHHKGLAGHRYYTAKQIQDYRQSIQDQGECYYTVRRAAAWLKISEATLRKREKEGKLMPHHRTLGGHRRYTQAQLEAYGQSQR